MFLFLLLHEESDAFNPLFPWVVCLLFSIQLACVHIAFRDARNIFQRQRKRFLKILLVEMVSLNY